MPVMTENEYISFFNKEFVKEINEIMDPTFMLDETTTELRLKLYVPFNNLYIHASKGTLIKDIYNAFNRVKNVTSFNKHVFAFNESTVTELEKYINRSKYAFSDTSAIHLFILNESFYPAIFELANEIGFSFLFYQDGEIKHYEYESTEDENTDNDETTDEFVQTMLESVTDKKTPFNFSDSYNQLLSEIDVIIHLENCGLSNGEKTISEIVKYHPNKNNFSYYKPDFDFTYSVVKDTYTNNYLLFVTKEQMNTLTRQIYLILIEDQRVVDLEEYLPNKNSGNDYELFGATVSEIGKFV